MTVCHVTSDLSAQGAGIREVVMALSRAQTKADIEVEVLGLETPGWTSGRSEWDHLRATACRVRGPGAFGYAPEMLQNLCRINPDIVHLHGIWMHPSRSVLKWSERTGKPRIISPHGMLDPWAIKNSYWKKRIVSLLYETRNLHGAACLHALNRAEAMAFRNLGMRNPIAIIPNGIDVPPPAEPLYPDWYRNVPRGAKLLLFLGRVHPKKGLDVLLRSLASTEAARDWHLIIAGWTQGDYLMFLRRITAQLSLSHRVHFVGPVYGDMKWATLRLANAFVLPSYSEGLPVAVLEAWACGLPVLMTRACNLPEGKLAGAAIEVDTTETDIRSGLDILASMDSLSMNKMGQLGLSLVGEHFSWNHISGKFLKTYEWLCGGGQLPDWIEMA